MHLLDRAPVGADEIDTLGHMNVRCYQQRMERANARLLADLGLEPAALEDAGQRLVRFETFTRYLHEQFAGAEIEVHGGVLDAAADYIQLFYELRNAAKGQSAATFIIKVGVQTQAERAERTLPGAVVARAQADTIALPDYGAPRTLDLDPPRLDLTLEAIEGRVADQREINMMGGRFKRVVEADECDAHGFLEEGEHLMFPSRRMEERRASGKPFGPPTFTTDDGRRFGWAWMETRIVDVRRPRAGDVLRSTEADLGLGRKTRHARRWVFNLTRGELAGMEDTVAIALDLDARRAMEIPDALRARLERGHVPEFA